MSNILTSHIRSVPRTQKVVSFTLVRENKTVAKQAATGVDIVSDATYVKDRDTGFMGDSLRNTPTDLKHFPMFLKRLTGDGGTPQFARPMCAGEVKSEGGREQDIAKLSALFQGAL